MLTKREQVCFGNPLKAMLTRPSSGGAIFKVPLPVLHTKQPVDKKEDKETSGGR